MTHKVLNLKKEVPVHKTTKHSLNMELDRQSLFGLLCTAVLIG
jgi:hypothetical protein